MGEQQLRVLLLDDEVSLRVPLQQFLQNSFGYCVDGVASGEEALACVEAGSYDVALIDQVLEGGLQGIDVMQAIRARHPNMECIIFTGWGDSTKQRAQQAGAFRYLEKPFDKDELALVIRSAAQQVRLRAISRSIVSKLDLDHVLEEIVAAARSLAVADASAIALLDARTGRLQIYGRAHAGERWRRHFTGRELCREIIAGGRAVSIPDIQELPDADPGFKRAGFHAFVGVPVPGDAANLGALFVYSRTPGHFDALGAVPLLHTLAGQAGVAIVNARAVQQIRLHARHMEALMQAGQGFTRARRVEEQLALAWNFVRTQLAVSTFFVGLCDSGVRVLRFSIAYDEGKPVVLPDVKLDGQPDEAGITGYVARTGTELAWNTAAEGRECCAAHGVHCRHYGRPAESSFYYPLRAGDNVLGVVSMQSYEPNAFTDIELDACRTLGSQLAVALENTRLFEAEADRRREADTLRQGALAVTSTLGQDAVLTAILAELGRVVPYDSASVQRLCGEHLEIIGGCGFPNLAEILGAPFRLDGENPNSEVIATRRPLIVQDARALYRTFSERPHNQTLIRGWLGVPMLVGDRVVGMLALDRHEAGFYTPEHARLAEAFAAQAAIAIENARLYEETQRREKLLEALDEASRHMRAEKETDKLLQEVVRLAAQLADCQAGALFINRPHLEELELHALWGLPAELTGRRFAHGEGLAGRVAHTGHAQVRHGARERHAEEFAPDGLEVVAGVPLKQAGVVTAVLTVLAPLDEAHPRAPAALDVEILERFATQAAIALQTSQLLGREQRSLVQVRILHQIVNYIQAAEDLDKIMHVMLTGVTAGYGLGFNRAALFLLDDSGEVMEGKAGIGCFAEADARLDWARHVQTGREDFQRYLELLEANALPTTPLGERVRAVRWPATPEGGGCLHSLLVAEVAQVLPAALSAALPPSFVEAFEPAFPLAVAPLRAGDRAIGLLIADNKFTQLQVTPDDLEALVAFVNTLAVALENARLNQDNLAARKRLRSSYEASNELVCSQDLDRMLRDIVERARLTAAADGVSLILMDSAGNTRASVTAGVDVQSDIREVARADGVSMRVMQGQQYHAVPDTHAQSAQVHPDLLSRGVRAALCLPVILEGQGLGVMWFHYYASRRFPESEIEAVQFYVNQAALAYDSARRIRALAHLQRAAESLADAGGLPEVLQRIVACAQDALEADSTALWSHDPVRDTLVAEESVALGIDADQWREFCRNDQRVGRTAERVMALRWVGVSDVEDEQSSALLGDTTRRLLAQAGVRSFQGIALMAGEEPLGVLYVNYARRRTFDAQDKALADAVAHHAALALKNMRLLQEVRRAHATARVVAEVSALEDLPQALCSIVTGTQTVLRCDAVTLYTYDEDHDEFDFPPTMVGVKDEASVLQLNGVARTSVVRTILMLDRPYETDDAQTDPRMQGPFVQREGVRASVGLPLLVRGRRVGVMFVNYRSFHRFTPEDLANIGLFAYQAGVAIRNAQLYRQACERLAESLALQDAATSLAGTLGLQDMLAVVLGAALEGAEAESCSIVRWEARYQTFTHTIELTEPRRELHWYRSRARVQGGLARAIVDSGEAIVVEDTSKDPRISPVVLARGWTAVAGVPLLSEGQAIGVLYANNPHSGRFSARTLDLLRSLASLAVVAIDRAQQYEDLRKARGLVNARTALAGMGLATSEWIHDVRTQAVIIRDRIGLLREDLGEVGLGARRLAVEEHLALLERLSAEIVDKDIAPPLPSEAGVELVSPTDLVFERARQLWQNDGFQDIQLIPCAELPPKATVRISREWLRRAFDVVVKNAVDATRGCPVREIVIGTRRVGPGAEIYVTDSGRGMSPDVRLRLGTQIFYKQDPTGGSHGMGVGLAMAATIMEAFGGEVRAEEPDPMRGASGASVVLWLPLAEERPT